MKKFILTFVAIISIFSVYAVPSTIAYYYGYPGGCYNPCNAPYSYPSNYYSQPSYPPVYNPPSYTNVNYGTPPQVVITHVNGRPIHYGYPPEQRKVIIANPPPYRNTYSNPSSTYSNTYSNPPSYYNPNPYPYYVPGNNPSYPTMINPEGITYYFDPTSYYNGYGGYRGNLDQYYYGGYYYY